MYLLATVQNVIMHVALFVQFVVVILLASSSSSVYVALFFLPMLLEFRNPIQSPYLTKKRKKQHKNQNKEKKLNIQQTRC